MRVFDADETAGDEWLDPVDAFAEAIVHGLIPVAIPVTIDGERALAALSFAMRDRVRATALSPDHMVRAKLAVGLVVLTRDRVRDELAAEGVSPA